jgi:hypothetical protein
MKRTCGLCGESIVDMDFYVLSAGAAICSSCIVSRGILVRRAHPGRELPREMPMHLGECPAMADGRS